MIGLLLACAEPPVEPLPTAAVATGVRGDGPGWAAVAASVRFAAGEARASEPTLVTAADGKPPLEITADRSDWDLKAGKAHFSGKVSVHRGEVVLTCAELDVVYRGADRVQSVVATGGVHVTRGGRTADAARAELDGDSGRITLTGDPRLGEGPNTLVGASIVLWLDDERATCEGAAGTPCRLVVAGSALR